MGCCWGGSRTQNTSAKRLLPEHNGKPSPRTPSYASLGAPKLSTPSSTGQQRKIDELNSPITRPNNTTPRMEEIKALEAGDNTVPNGWMKCADGYYNVVTCKMLLQKPKISIEPLQIRDNQATYQDVTDLFFRIQVKLLNDLTMALEEELGDSVQLQKGITLHNTVERDPLVGASCCLIKIILEFASKHFNSVLRDTKTTHGDWRTVYIGEQEALQEKFEDNFIETIKQELSELRSLFLKENVMQQARKFLSVVYELLVATHLVQPELFMPVDTVGKETLYYPEYHSIIITKDIQTSNCRILFPGIVVKADAKMAFRPLVAY